MSYTKAALVLLFFIIIIYLLLYAAANYDISNMHSFASALSRG